LLVQLTRLAIERERSETDSLCGWDWHVYPTIAANLVQGHTNPKNLAQNPTRRW